MLERPIWPEELEGFEQMFLTGTAAEVTPVQSAGPWKFEVGELTRQLAGTITISSTAARPTARRAAAGCGPRRGRRAAATRPDPGVAQRPGRRAPVAVEADDQLVPA